VRHCGFCWDGYLLAFLWVLRIALDSSCWRQNTTGEMCILCRATGSEPYKFQREISCADGKTAEAKEDYEDYASSFLLTFTVILYQLKWVILRVSNKFFE
jgi:hypothetical protein